MADPIRLNAPKTYGSIVIAVAVCWVLLLLTDYRVFIGQMRSDPPSTTAAPSQAVSTGGITFDARHYAALPSGPTCKYFTGTSVVTVTFHTVDSCPFLYRPKAYNSL